MVSFGHLFYSRLRKVLLWFWRSRAVLFRLLFCWILACVFLYFDESHNYDWRFTLRGKQSHFNDIVSIEIRSDQILHFSNDQKLVGLNQGFRNLIQHIQNSQPQLILFNFDFENLFFGSTPAKKLKQEFSNTRNIILRSGSKSHPQSFYPSGSDGVFRSYKKDFQPTSLLVDQTLKKLDRKSRFPSRESRLINFRGPANTFQIFSFNELISGQIDYFLKDKIIILDVSPYSLNLQTPVGALSNNEILANILDNELLNRWISRSNLQFNFIFLGLLSVLGIAIMLVYPHFFSLVIIGWVATAIISLSIWLFDSFNIWIPVLSPTLLLLIVYIIFIGYQLSLIENQTWRLEQERKYLLEVEELKNNFVSLISHDLKTPIAKIQAIVDHIKTKNIDSEIKIDLESIKNESSELHRYIQSILKITRVESKDIKLNIEPTDINKIIKSVVEQLKPLADTKNISISVDLEPLFLIDVDKTLIFEVILNILENAIKYSYNDEIITVRSRETDNTILLSFEDHGPGITQEEQLNVFKKFHRGKDHSFDSKGSGLGLYLVKYFVELHGGRVSLESEAKKGSTFTISLPL